MQSEEDRLDMERRIQLAEEKMSSSGRRDSETEELRRELEEARMAERMAKMQLQEARQPQSPPLNSSVATNASSSAMVRHSEKKGSLNNYKPVFIIVVIDTLMLWGWRKSARLNTMRDRSNWYITV